MARRTRRPSRRRRTYRSSPLHRHRARVAWLRAQRTRVRNYLRRFGTIGNGGKGDIGNNGEIGGEN
ncbi:hypothetical protein [Microbulbifer hainanensis]|uniref:hypothetical protein n=1 Tax=Microbulbifer hainanensis TaxID=2735675 RepID=UPI0018687854|nr:hypothetical protein [Microbulbifer hainanensis]